MLRSLFRSGHAYEDISRLLARVPTKGACLDLPAGTGVNFAGISSAGFAPVEADLFPGRAGPPGCRRVKCDFNQPLPFAAGAFAAVLCSEGIEHHPAQTWLVREFHRVLMPGGALLITTPNVLNLRARLATLLTGNHSSKASVISEATQFWKAPDGSGHFIGHAHMVDYFELRFVLATNGFAVDAVTTAKYSPSSVALAPLLWLPVRLATGYALVRALRRHPALRAELTAAATSVALLFGKKLIVLARRLAS